MKRVAAAELPLHGGKAPPWLLSRMRKLADGITVIIIDEYGTDELLRRLTDPAWFQAFGCVLGFDWHSSGVTTVVTGVLKSVLKPEYGVLVAGGKGRHSQKAPLEIQAFGTAFGLSDDIIGSLVHASRMSAKIDTAAIQAGYDLYHHAFFLTRDGKWIVIQQGMDVQNRTARRYHWISDHVTGFIDTPHAAIVGDIVKDCVLDMTAKESQESRNVALDLVRDGIGKLKDDMALVQTSGQMTLGQWASDLDSGRERNLRMETLTMPRHINWEALEKVYEQQPVHYEELIAAQGVGPAAIRGLALVSDLIYGAKPSWKDPVRYSFAYGGKDGGPRPVDRRAMDESITFLRGAIEEARLDERDRLSALKRLSSCDAAAAQVH